ncbi:MAG: caspase family protein [Nitrospirae bacterium]|nr:caspase family protein [Nitrospirota bacterium]
MKTFMIFVLFLTLILPSYAYSARAKPAVQTEEQTKFRTLKGHSGEVLAAALSPDGKMLATGGADEIVILWDLSSGEKLKTLKDHSHDIRALAFSPDSKILASGGDDEDIILWNTATAEKIKSIEVSDSILSLAFSPDGQTIAAGTEDEKVVLWNHESEKKVRTLKGHSDEVYSVAFSPDGKTLASGSGDKTIILWDAQTGSKLNTLKGHQETVISVAFSPDGQILASGSYDKTIALWNIAKGEKINTLTDNKNYVQAVAFSPDGKILVSGNKNKTINIWDAQTGNKMKTLSGHNDVVTSVVFTRDGSSLVSASEDENIIVWDIGARMEFAASPAPGARPAPRPSAAKAPETKTAVITAPDIKTPVIPAPETKTAVIAAPELIYDIKIEDTSGNGILEGGETVIVTVSIENKGKGTAQGVEVLLSGNDTLTSCLGNIRIAGDIEPYGKRKITIQCSLPTRLKAETAHLSIELAERRGYSPVEIKSFAIALKPAEIKETQQIISRHIDVDAVPLKNDSFKRENSYALVIGISNYRDKLIPQVKYAKADAETFAKYLENIGGIPKKNIKLVTDEMVTIGDLEAYIEDWLPRMIKKDSKVFIYYAGHGTPDPQSGEAFIVPYDGHPDFKSKLYPLKRMYASLNKLPSEQVVVMLDSCFSGAGERGVVSQGARPISISVENPILAGGNVFVLAAASGTQISSDFEKVRHGLFTYYLLKGMKGDADKDNNNNVELQELYDYVKENVSETASTELNRDQIPVLLPEQQKTTSVIEITRVK